MGYGLRANGIKELREGGAIMGWGICFDKRWFFAFLRRLWGGRGVV